MWPKTIQQNAGSKVPTLPNIRAHPMLMAASNMYLSETGPVVSGGSLWYLYDFTKKDAWEKAAVKWTESLESNQYNTTHHDIGFMMYLQLWQCYQTYK